MACTGVLRTAGCSIVKGVSSVCGSSLIRRPDWTKSRKPQQVVRTSMHGHAQLESKSDELLLRAMSLPALMQTGRPLVASLAADAAAAAMLRRLLIPALASRQALAKRPLPATDRLMPKPPRQSVAHPASCRQSAGTSATPWRWHQHSLLRAADCCYCLPDQA